MESHCHDDLMQNTIQQTRYELNMLNVWLRETSQKIPSKSRQATEDRLSPLFQKQERGNGAITEYGLFKFKYYS
jgi:hypothetical protein